MKSWVLRGPRQLERGVIDTGALVTHRLPLREAPQTLIKIVILP